MNQVTDTSATFLAIAELNTYALAAAVTRDDAALCELRGYNNRNKVIIIGTKKCHPARKSSGKAYAACSTSPSPGNTSAQNHIKLCVKKRSSFMKQAHESISTKNRQHGKRMTHNIII